VLRTCDLAPATQQKLIVKIEDAFLKIQIQKDSKQKEKLTPNNEPSFSRDVIVMFLGFLVFLVVLRRGR
jgi:hypothetical protein